MFRPLSQNHITRNVESDWQPLSKTDMNKHTYVHICVYNDICNGYKRQTMPPVFISELTGKQWNLMFRGIAWAMCMSVKA